MKQQKLLPPPTYEIRTVLDFLQVRVSSEPLSSRF